MFTEKLKLFVKIISKVLNCCSVGDIIKCENLQFDKLPNLHEFTVK